ncbi:chemotaxis protein CheB [Deinococcus deserti]|uniref:protein-glutamate methylesterase n=1 Tax=Deinococcus deserti (strain DSM 17065 / CIP 109153 / LMG 22923 / VCD115) TaxID=546414 RepID=C1D207_DEIDV|nr:chemotaxis protein CheB [Deinococcus deserti]ACO47446.1 putative protein-glutamate methylesterase (CheB methylesterase) [Deinococcus deserti VCD115]
MTDFPLVVIGASAGGVSALMKLCAQLPSSFPAAVLVVQHVSPAHPSMLPRILSAAGTLHAIHPRDGQTLHPGMIYVAPPDHHLLVDGETVLLSRGPRENRSRPAIDVLFRSAAVEAGSRVIGVVLTGNLDDGTSGLHVIKQAGGLAVVQDPDDAEFASMPRSALNAVKVDHVAPLSELGALLASLVDDRARNHRPTPLASEDVRRLEVELGVAREEHALSKGVTRLGAPSPLTCPECHGTLIEIREGTLVRFRCHSGHAYTAGTLLTEVSESVESKAYQALRALGETVILLRQLSDQRQKQGDPAGAEAFLARAREVEASSEGIRALVRTTRALSVEKVERPDFDG